MSASRGVRLRDEGEGRAASDDRSAYLVVEPGDIVVNRLSARDGAIGRSDLHGIVSPAYWVLRAAPEVDSRFLAYCLRSGRCLDEITRLSKFMPPAQYDIGWEDFRDIKIPLPELSEQVAIANYLDAYTTTIDELTEARRAQIELLREEGIAALQERLASWPIEPARRVISDCVVGIVVQPSAIYTEDPAGVPTLRGIDVKEGEIARHGHVRITPEGHARHPRSRLHAGDVVVVRTGDAGAAAVVPDWAEGWNAIDLVIVRPNSRMSSEYLEMAINAQRHAAEVSAASSGSIQQHFGVNALRSLPIAVPPVEVQADIVAEVHARRRAEAKAVAALQESLGVLAEYRLSLIDEVTAGTSAARVSGGVDQMVKC